MGAAIWLAEMNSVKEGVNTAQISNPKAEALIERFLESSDYEFECAKIVGRKFENVEEHASYLHEGGCTKISEAFAA